MSKRIKEIEIAHHPHPDTLFESYCIVLNTWQVCDVRIVCGTPIHLLDFLVQILSQSQIIASATSYRVILQLVFGGPW